MSESETKKSICVSVNMCVCNLTGLSIWYLVFGEWVCARQYFFTAHNLIFFSCSRTTLPPPPAWLLAYLTSDINTLTHRSVGKTDQTSGKIRKLTTGTSHYHYERHLKQNHSLLNALYIGTVFVIKDASYLASGVAASSGRWEHRRKHKLIWEGCCQVRPLHELLTASVSIFPRTSGSKRSFKIIYPRGLEV